MPASSLFWRIILKVDEAIPNSSAISFTVFRCHSRIFSKFPASHSPKMLLSSLENLFLIYKIYWFQKWRQKKTLEQHSMLDTYHQTRKCALLLIIIPYLSISSPFPVFYLFFGWFFIFYGDMKRDCMKKYINYISRIKGPGKKSAIAMKLL